MTLATSATSRDALALPLIEKGQKTTEPPAVVDNKIRNQQIIDATLLTVELEPTTPNITYVSLPG